MTATAARSTRRRRCRPGATPSAPAPDHFPAGAATPHAAGQANADGRSWSRPFGPVSGERSHPLFFTYSLMLATFLGTMGLPHILVRFYTNPDGGPPARRP